VCAWGRRRNARSDASGCAEDGGSADPRVADATSFSLAFRMTGHAEPRSARCVEVGPEVPQVETKSSYRRPFAAETTLKGKSTALETARTRDRERRARDLSEASTRRPATSGHFRPRVAPPCTPS
jgi:hypothetical protein